MENQLQLAEISNHHRNIMGTLSFDMKVKPMRKTQDFIVYPIDEEGKSQVTIQSGTRIGIIDLSKKTGVLTKSYPNGAYFHHLSFNKETHTKFVLSDNQVEELVGYIKKTSGKLVGNSVIKSDNSGAESIVSDADYEEQAHRAYYSKYL